ncbi:MAG: DNA polymerase I [Candidatus Eremiobacteraeota bacterium]|nr:DNA polymerase I [Candidatus Eremiobacteraeota bacterium]MBV9699123.1 DNA polymerase I [Candidatus Eremiobacteraeota bacterium]
MALMLLDTYGLVYRAYFALPPLNTSKGTPINAAYGFTMMLNKLIADEKPTHVVAAFDKGMPAERIARFAEYKAQRRTMPDDLRSQFAIVRRVLQTHRIPIAEVEGQEADDVIATLARQAEENGEATIVVTGDLDLLQIVNERTTVLTTRRGITELGRYDPDAVRERFGLEPTQLPDYRGLKGDPSDNLPGIPGVGEKTAGRLLQNAGSLDALVADPTLAGNPKLEQLIRQYGQQACLCRAVSIVRRDLPIALEWESIRYVPPSEGDLYALYSELEFKTLLNKLSAPQDMPLLESQPMLSGNYRSYTASSDPPDLLKLAGDLRKLASQPHIAIAWLGDAIGVTANGGEGISFGRAALGAEPVRSALDDVLRSAQSLCAYDAKRLTHLFEQSGVGRTHFADDAMIAAHLLDPGRGFADIDDAATAFLGTQIPPEAAAHADATLQLVRATRAQLEARDQLRLYEDVELPLAPVLAKMEAAGVTIDPRELEVVAAEINSATARLQGKIYDFAGEEFNIGSPQQLGTVLFGKLQIPGGKKTKTGWATGVEVLQTLAREYPICALVLEWREVTKLKNTYVDVIPRLVDARDGRLRTEFKQTATATGRLSSTNPNLQNIPVRGELGRRIRRAFVARDDEHILLAADYSQIELRLMAHLSGDEAMRRAFEERTDVHDFTARQIFNVPADAVVDREQRRMAKIVNFGLLYGMSDFGLAQRLEIGRAEAKTMTAAYFDRFPRVREWIERTLEEARQRGYVATILGRRRYMPALRSGNYMLRAAAEREATNAPLQGSAADLMKLAMVRIDRALGERGGDAAMLLQIHDELIFEVRKSALRDVAALVREHMERAIELTVPLEVTLKWGRNWYDVEPIETDAFARV